MKIHLNGDFEDLKYFKLRKLKEEKNLLGYEIREIESKDEIGEAIQVGLFDTRPVLVIIHNASKLSKDDLERIFIASESFDLILVDKNTNKLKATHPLLKTETIEEPKKFKE